MQVSNLHTGIHFIERWNIVVEKLRHGNIYPNCGLTFYRTFVLANPASYAYIREYAWLLQEDEIPIAIHHFDFL